MAEKIIEKLATLEYNEQITLAIIEDDEDLRGIFLDETKAKSFTLIRTLLQENQLKQESKDFLKMIFEQIILTKQTLIDKYKVLENNGTFEVIPKPEEVLIPTVVEEIPKKTAEIVAEKVKVTKTEKSLELPRRYGKEKILADIKEQGGKATPLQNAMLKVNDLKNIYVNLTARGIKDMVGGTKLLTDEDSRKIVSVITIAERQLVDILKKK
jgi:hypothetical protein